MTQPVHQGKISKFRVGIVAGAVILVLAVIWGFFAITLTKADGGTVVVVREGGMLDDSSFREVVQPNSSITYTGLFSVEHAYPASQRYFKVSSSGSADSSEVINVPTKDGVDVGVEGTWYFELNTDEQVLKNFDDEFGTRTYPAPTADEPDRRLNAWDGDEGWAAFLDATLSNVTQTTARQTMQTVDCATLVASCALIRSGATTETVDAAASQANPQTISSLQQQMGDGFKSEINKILGDETLVNVQFTLAQVVLPQNVKDAIAAAQANITTANGNAQASIDAARGEAQAAQERIKTAEADASANQAKQLGYNACPVCQQIDLTKAIPPGVTVWAPGGEAAIAVAPAPAS